MVKVVKELADLHEVLDPYKSYAACCNCNMPIERFGWEIKGTEYICAFCADPIASPFGHTDLVILRREQFEPLWAQYGRDETLGESARRMQGL